MEFYNTSAYISKKYSCCTLHMHHLRRVSAQIPKEAIEINSVSKLGSKSMKK